MSEDKIKFPEIYYKCSCGGNIVPIGKYKMEGKCDICGKKYQRAPLGDGIL